MKALTIHQPYAQLISDGFKRHETRSWQTKYRGNVAIHAGKAWSKQQQYEIIRLATTFTKLSDYTNKILEYGSVLVVCRLVDIHRVEDIRDSLSPLERAVGNYSNDRFAWELEIIKHPEQPIPAKGKQGIWTWEYEKTL